MAKEVERLKELAICKHLAKTDRDAIAWALDQIGVQGEVTVKQKADDYPDEFLFIWGEYPKREGANSKKDAYKACRARLKNGSTWRQMAEGLRRYVRHCTEKGKIGTEFVMQAQTFFGPAKHFENDWAVNHEQKAKRTAEDDTNNRLLQQYGDTATRNQWSAGSVAGNGVDQYQVPGSIRAEVEPQGITIDMVPGCDGDDG